MRYLLSISTGVLFAGLTIAGATQLAAASEGDAEGDDDTSVVVRTPAVESVAVNFASESAEARISEDVRAKISDRAGLLASCYARHATGESQPEAVVTVDWTITTSGEPVGFTVFSSGESLQSCIRRTLSDLEFEHLDDAHPRARARLRFQ